jgi:TPP-dependent pyruvate/acetoin dehydrogenase alpha subunit
MEGVMPPDLWSLYALMKKSRLFEEAIARLWWDGLISGEMHLGTGEEAIIAGVVSQLNPGDALALDHRGTSALLLRGVDPGSILRELLGRPDGLCAGQGGHMHLFSKEHLAASSGIVGAAGSTAAGFALAAQHLRPGTLAVAFFGEGALNQGMLMESLNLAAVWKLPVLFVCKDDQWAITTKSDQMTGGSLVDRVRGLGVAYLQTDGRDAGQVWEAARKALESIRSGQGPVFLHAQCVHIKAHFLGYQLLRIIRNPLREMPAIAAPLLGSFLHPNGASPRDRLAGIAEINASFLTALNDPRRYSSNDPVKRLRAALKSDLARLAELERGLEQEVAGVLASALQEAAP